MLPRVRRHFRNTLVRGDTDFDRCDIFNTVIDEAAYFAVPSAPGAARVRVWAVMSRGRGPRTVTGPSQGRPPPEGVDVAYPQGGWRWARSGSSSFPARGLRCRCPRGQRGALTVRPARSSIGRSQNASRKERGVITLARGHAAARQGSLAGPPEFAQPRSPRSRAQRVQPVAPMVSIYRAILAALFAIGLTIP